MSIIDVPCHFVNRFEEKSFVNFLTVRTSKERFVKTWDKYRRIVGFSEQEY